MGKGGCIEPQKAGAAVVQSPTSVSSKTPPPRVDPIEYAKEHGDWVSPFTPEKVDPRLRVKEGEEELPGNTKQIIKTINSEFPTKSELRNVIPKHCFTRPLHWSFFYVFRDVLQGVAVWYLTYHVIGLSTAPPEGGLFGNPLAWMAWRLAWNVYALVMTMAVGGLWIVAHECGHGAFSDYKVVNGTVGWFFHSIFLVPYFSWAFSHAKHHKRTNDLVDGETHKPVLHTELGLDEDKQRIPNAEVKKLIYGGGIHQAAENNLLGHARAHDAFGDEGFAFFMMYSRLFYAWQIYLCGVNSTGLHTHDGKVIPKDTFPDHFRPHSLMFPPKMYWKVVASDIGIGMVLSVLFYCSYLYGFRAVWFWYFGPYILANAFLVTVTWLHHTDPTVPHFDEANWTWMKGSLAGTIDRPVYPIVNYLSHNISTTHVVHHLFHEIPHYHAVEATKHLKEYLEPKGLYNYDPTPAHTALWKICKRCHYVDSVTDGVQYYQSLEDIPRTKDLQKAAVETTKKDQ